MHLLRRPRELRLVIIVAIALPIASSSRSLEVAAFGAMATKQSVEITGGIVPPSDRFTADLPLVFHVTHLNDGQTEEYDLLLAPLPSGGSASGQFDPAESEIEVFEGFGYFLGTHPRARTRRVSATGHGTIMVVQIEENLDRIFFFEGLRVEVDSVSSTSDKTISLEDHYVEATGGNGVPVTISEQEPIPSDSSDPIRQFVVQVMQQAKKAKLEIPSGW